MDRVDLLCAYLDECRTLADVGCDHGYCTLTAFKSGKCECAIISDVSAKCLAKAEKLLSQYVSEGKCKAVVCDGLKDIPRSVDQALIAGMGGEEIIKILKEGFIPEKFVLQPMKNADKLRRFLIDSDCRIIEDDVFTDGKFFYFVIKGTRPRDGIAGVKESYSELELKFGRDSLKNPLLKSYAEAELKKRRGHLNGCTNRDTIKTILHDISLYEEVLK